MCLALLDEGALLEIEEGLEGGRAGKAEGDDEARGASGHTRTRGADGLEQLHLRHELPSLGMNTCSLKSAR